MDGCHGVNFWIGCEALSFGRRWMGFVSKPRNQLSEVKFKIFWTPTKSKTSPT